MNDKSFVKPLSQPRLIIDAYDRAKPYYLFTSQQIVSLDF